MNSDNELPAEGLRVRSGIGVTGRMLAAGRAFRAFMLSFVALAGGAAVARAEVVIDIQAPVKPVVSESQVVVFSGDGMESVPVTQVVPLGRATYRLEFAPPPNASRGSFFSPSLVLEDGSKLSLPVKQVFWADGKAELRRPEECKRPDVNTLVLAQQQGLLESLVQVRSQRQEIAQKKLEQMMSPEQLEKLRRLEEGFGLRYAEPLSASLSPFELVDRLSRLHFALQSFRHNQRAVADTLQGAKK